MPYNNAYETTASGFRYGEGIPDSFFAELFGEEEIPPFEYGDDLDSLVLEAIQESLGEELDELSHADAQALQEIVPIIAGALARPLLKKAVPAVKNLLGKLFGKRKKQAAQMSLPQAQAPAEPQPAPYPSPGVAPAYAVPPQAPPVFQPAPPEIPPVPPAAGNALVNLLRMVQNPNVLGALSSLAITGASKPLTLGSQQTQIREGSVLNAIMQLAGRAKAEIADSSYPDALEYLKDARGNFAVDISDERARAERLVELLNS